MTATSKPDYDAAVLCNTLIESLNNVTDAVLAISEHLITTSELLSDYCEKRGLTTPPELTHGSKNPGVTPLFPAANSNGGVRRDTTAAVWILNLTLRDGTKKELGFSTRTELEHILFKDHDPTDISEICLNAQRLSHMPGPIAAPDWIGRLILKAANRTERA